MKNAYTLLTILFCFISSLGYGQFYQAVATGDWDDPNTWIDLFSGTPGVPGASDIARIQGAFAVTVTGNESCANLILSDDGNAATTALTVASNASLSVGSIAAVSAGAFNAQINLTVESNATITFNNDFDVSCVTTNASIQITNEGSMIFNGALSLFCDRGSLNVNQLGSWTTNSTVLIEQSVGTSTVNMDNPGAIWFFNGSWVAPSISWGSLSNGTNNSTFVYSGSSSQTLEVQPSLVYHDIGITNTSGVTLGGNLNSSTILGDLTVDGHLLLDGNAIAGNASASITVNGRLEMSGASVFPSGFGSVDIASTSTVEYSRSDGSSQNVANITYSTLEITGNGTKELVTSTYASSGGATNLVDIQNGIFDLNNLSFALISNSSRTANLGTLGATSGITGTSNFSAQRYFDGMSNPGWRHLASPIIGTTLADWMDCAGPGSAGIYMYGFTGSCNPSSNYFNVSLYVEGLAASSTATTGSAQFNAGYFTNPAAFSSSTSTDATSGLAPGGGYTIYTGGSSYPSHSLELTGNPNTGNISIPLSYTASSHSQNGWNFIANPYPSAINWTTVQAASSNVGANAYLWSGNSGWQSVASNGGEIASGQAFFVKATSSGGSINFTEGAKVTSNTNFIRSSVQDEELVVVQLFDHQFKYSNKAFLKSQALASNNYVGGEDIPKMIKTSSNHPHVYWKVGPHQVETNVIMELSNNSGDLVFDVPEAGVYYLTLNTEAGRKYTLRDNNSFITYLIEPGDTLGLQLNANDTSTTYTLAVQTPLQAIHIAEESCYGAGDARATFDLYTYSDIGLYDREGQLLYSASGSNRVSIENLTHGVYHYRIESSTAGNKVGRIEIEEQPKVESEFYLSNYVLDLSQSGLVETNNYSEGHHYEWYVDDELVSTDYNTSFTIDEAGEHIIKLLSFSSNEVCMDSKVSKITAFENFTSVQEQAVLKSRFIIETHNTHFIARSQSQTNTELNYQLYDTSGKLVWSTLNTNESSVKVPRLGNGIYLLKINGEGINETIKLVP